MVAARKVTKPNPKIAEVVDAVNQLHECFEDQRQDIAELKNDVARHGGLLEGIAIALGMSVANREAGQTVSAGAPPAAPKYKPFGLWSPIKALGAVAAAGAAGAGAYRILWNVGVAVVEAVHRTLLTLS